MNEQELIDETNKISSEIEVRVLEAIGQEEKVTHVIVALTNIIVLAISMEKTEKGKQAAVEYLIEMIALSATEAGIKKYGLFNVIEQAYQKSGAANV